MGRRPVHITGKADAIKRDGTCVLYKCHRAGHEEWYDFFKDPRYWSHTPRRRLDIAMSSAQFVMNWHSKEKGGGYVECSQCRKSQT